MIKNFHLKLLVSRNTDKDSYHEEKEKIYSISGSKFGAVFGCGGISKSMLWHILKGNKKQKRFESYASRRGREEEPKAAKFFSDLIGARLYSIGCCVLYKDSRLCACPDRLFTHPITKLKEGLEIKNPDTTPIPQEVNSKMISYVFQCILNMEVFDRDYWNLFYYDRRTGEYSWFRITRNEKFFDTYLHPLVNAFLQSVEDNIPPPDRTDSKEKKKMIELIYSEYPIHLVKYNPPSEIKI